MFAQTQKPMKDEMKGICTSLGVRNLQQDEINHCSRRQNPSR